MNNLRRARIEAWAWLEARPRNDDPSPKHDAWLRDGPYYLDALLVALERDPAFADFQVPVISPAATRHPEQSA